MLTLEFEFIGFFCLLAVVFVFLLSCLFFRNCLYANSNTRKWLSTLIVMHISTLDPSTCSFLCNRSYLNDFIIPILHNTWYVKPFEFGECEVQQRQVFWIRNTAIMPVWKHVNCTRFCCVHWHIQWMRLGPDVDFLLPFFCFCFLLCFFALFFLLVSLIKCIYARLNTFIWFPY